MDEDPTTMAHGDRTGLSLHAGFPNPAADVGGSSPLSLDRLLIQHPSSTYLFRVRGDDWQHEGIFDGDIAMIDRSLTPRAHDLVISWPDDSFILHHFSSSRQARQPEPWGTVTHIIHTFHDPKHTP